MLIVPKLFQGKSDCYKLAKKRYEECPLADSWHEEPYGTKYIKVVIRLKPCTLFQAKEHFSDAREAREGDLPEVNAKKLEPVREPEMTEATL